jgi:hypothetical protein
METLSGEVQRFLDTVLVVDELEASDAALAEAGRTLWAQLSVAEDMGSAEVRTPTMRKLGLVGELRGQIARQLADIRTREALQVLAQ